MSLKPSKNMGHAKAFVSAYDVYLDAIRGIRVDLTLSLEL